MAWQLHPSQQEAGHSSLTPSGPQNGACERITVTHSPHREKLRNFTLRNFRKDKNLVVQIGVSRQAAKRVTVARGPPGEHP